MDVRQFLEWTEREGALRKVGRATDPHLELASVMFALDGAPVLFDALSGYPGWRAMSGMCARREHIAAALGCAVPELIHYMAGALESPEVPPVQESGPCQDVVRGPDLSQLPIPRYHSDDGGPYVTAGVATVKDPDFGRNTSFHRLMLLDERHLAARIVEGRGTHTALGKEEDGLPVAVAVGAPIQVLLAAAMSPAKGVDELAIAHALAPTPLVRCQTVPVEVPAEAELIFEGRITRALADEGPFPDLTGTMDHVREQPVIEIDRITHRRDPVFHALLPGGMEHKNLMGMPREPT
ncbi:MAG: UbiD family decarboxylase, partial [Anaerolineae bacterium]